jgi:hypothetical protein
MQPRTLAVAALGLALAPHSLAADPIADFYRGKDIQFVIRTGPGGGYDLYSRLLGRHIGKHIPGNPGFIAVNMPGGGGITAANHVALIAPKDGTVLTIVSQGLVMDKALGVSPSLKADLATFNWLGAITASNQVMVVWHTSPTRTVKDLETRVTTIGTTGAGSASVQLPSVYISMLGWKLKLVTGYPTGVDIDLAMERGEVEGRGTNPWASYKMATPHFITDKKVVPLIQVGVRKDPELPNVPLLSELARKPEDKPVLDFVSRSVSVGWPIAVTPGAPPERVAALRIAYEATLKDAQFLADAEKSKAEIGPVSADEITRIIKELFEAPASVKETVKKALEPPSEMAEKK